MNAKNDTIYSNMKKWHLLTEISAYYKVPSPETSVDTTSQDAPDKSSAYQVLHPALQGVPPALVKLLWDDLCYLYSGANVRIKRLGISARAFEQAKHEGLEKQFFFESSAGQSKYLIPESKTFVAFNMRDPFDAGDLREHSFYKNWCAFINSKNPAYKTVQIEAKIGNSGSMADGITIRHDGTRIAWEITLSTKNILSNATKYTNTDIALIIFLCRNYKLREAVKADCREGGLNPDLLARLDYMHFSQLLHRNKKFYHY